MMLLQSPPTVAPLRPPAIVYTPVDERGESLDLRGDDLALWQAVHEHVYLDTRSPIKALSAAIGAVNRRNRDLGLRSTVLRPSDHIAGWGLHFGSPAQRDTHRTWFSRRTNFHLIRGQHIPLYWDHQEGEQIGYVTGWQRYQSWGYWFNCIVRPAYKDLFIPMAAAGRWHFSTACREIDVRKTDEGEILDWPIEELSACPNPSEQGLGSIIVDYPRIAA